MKADGKMTAQLDGPSEVGLCAPEGLEGHGLLPRRTNAQRAQIAAESMSPGVSIADVARRHGTPRWLIYEWRKRLRNGELAPPESGGALPAVAELVADAAGATRQRRAARPLWT